MPIPASFIRDGFQQLGTVLNRKRIMIGIDGPPDSGKTEFALSCPGPGLAVILDRGLDGCVDNPNPPKSRHTDWGIKIVQIPLPTQLGTAQAYLEHWKVFYEWYRKAMENVEARSILVDGDSDSWELQRLAEFGRLTQIMPDKYAPVNAARKAMYSRAWDSGKVCIFTNKIKKEYVATLDSQGNPIIENGREKRIWSGEWERQGYPDQDYLFHIQLSAQYRPAREIKSKFGDRIEPAQYGVRVNKFKRDRSKVGMELWGTECNFAGMVHSLYPEVPDREWGL